jgi:hypothetical protein
VRSQVRRVCALGTQTPSHNLYGFRLSPVKSSHPCEFPGHDLHKQESLLEEHFMSCLRR